MSRCKHKWHKLGPDEPDFENSHICLKCGDGKVALSKLKWVFTIRWLTFGLGFDYIFKYREFLIKIGPFIVDEDSEQYLILSRIGN